MFHSVLQCIVTVSYTHLKRLSALTESILQLSRLESCEDSAQKEIYSLDEQIRESILMFENEWTAKKIDMDIDLASVNYCAICDLLVQVWQNLISNAVKFSHEYGAIPVSYTHLDVYNRQTRCLIPSWTEVRYTRIIPFQKTKASPKNAKRCV